MAHKALPIQSGPLLLPEFISIANLVVAFFLPEYFALSFLSIWNIISPNILTACFPTSFESLLKHSKKDCHLPPFKKNCNPSSFLPIFPPFLLHFPSIYSIYGRWSEGKGARHIYMILYTYLIYIICISVANLYII